MSFKKTQDVKRDRETEKFQKEDPLDAEFSEEIANTLDDGNPDQDLNNADEADDAIKVPHPDTEG